MKKIFILLFIMVAAVAMLSVKGTLASGDKVRGEKAEGNAVRICDSNYGDCPYGNYEPEPNPVMTE